jgi:glycosyltransferase involved in cell wall biosynthesis
MDFSTISNLVRVCKQNQIDIIHSHDYKSHFYGGIAAKLASCRQVATLHGKTFGDVKNRAYELVENLLLRLASHITVVSEPLYEDLSKTSLEKKLSLVANGVDDKNFSPDVKGFGKQYWGFDPSCFVFGIIARLSEEKGHQVLLEAFSKLNKQNENIRLLLVGDGSLNNDLMNLTKELGLIDKVKFTGSRTEIEQILNDIDCYVSPSHTEGMPMSILEAMASALPIVATDVGAVGYLLRDDHGKLVPPGDVDGLAEQMQSILDEKNSIQKYGDRCRIRVEEEYSAGIQSRKFAKIYRSVL